MNELTMDDRGMFTVQTAHSVYAVNLTDESKTLVRMTGDRGSKLRADGEKVELLKIHRCHVGHGAVLIIQLPEVDDQTVRSTTRVVSIERVE